MSKGHDPVFGVYREVTDEQFKHPVDQLKPWVYQCTCTTSVSVCATWRHVASRGSTWGQGQDPAWTERT